MFQSGLDKNMSDAKKTPEIATGAKAAGQVDRDSRGNNVWRWKQGGTDSTSIVLKRLENDALRLEPTQAVPIPKPNAARPRSFERGPATTSGDADENGAEQTRGIKSGGFNPYDHS